MNKISVFNFVTANGYFAAADGDVSWAHANPDDEYAADMLEGNGALLFGRVTYEMMASFWPTEAASQSVPSVARGMNRAEKIVFSKTLKKADWQNTRVVSGPLGEETKKLKQTLGKNMTILGSGTIVTQLSALGLVDEYQLMVHPVVLGSGRTMFEGLEGRLDLKLTASRTLKSGNVLLRYQANPRG